MCRTSAPPRRDLYELETELAANEGGFFVAKTKPKPPRIGGAEWETVKPYSVAIYNADYMSTGERYAQFTDPWTVVGADTYERFPTHAEAIRYAFKETAK